MGVVPVVPDSAFSSLFALSRSFIAPQLHFPANLIPRVLRLRRRASTHALLVTTSHAQPLLRAELQLPIQLCARLLPVDEVAEPTPHAALTTIESAASLAKVGHGAEFAVDGARGVPARIQRVARRLRALLVLEARVHVADQVVVVVVADDDLLDLAVFTHLAPDVLVEGVEVILHL